MSYRNKIEVKKADDVDISVYIEDIKKWFKDPERLLEYEKSIQEAIKQNKKMTIFCGHPLGFQMIYGKELLMLLVMRALQP